MLDAGKGLHTTKWQKTSIKYFGILLFNMYLISLQNISISKPHDILFSPIPDHTITHGSAYSLSTSEQGYHALQS